MDLGDMSKNCLPWMLLGWMLLNGIEGRNLENNEELCVIDMEVMTSEAEGCVKN